MSGSDVDEPTATPGPSPRTERRRGPRHRRRGRLARRLLVALAVVVAVVIAVVVRAATEAVPAPRLHVAVASSVTVAGAPAHLAWPATGEAALAGPDGKTIGVSGSLAPVAVASITKVMTAYLVLQDHPLAAGADGPRLTITAAEAAEMPRRIAEGQSLVYVSAGEVFTERQALQALLIPSADNMAEVLARFDSGTEASFVAKMNATAARLRMTHTHFSDASGYSPGSVSDSVDLLRLARVAMADPTFATIVAERTATMPDGTTVHNYNTLLGTDGFTGIKTGSTSAAGQALLFSVDRPVGGRPVALLGVVLGQKGPGLVTQALDAATRLADSFYSQLGQRTVLPAGTEVARLTGPAGTVAMRTVAPLQALALAGARAALRVGPAREHGHTGEFTTTVDARSPTGAGSATATARVPRVGWGWRLAHIFG